MGSIIDKITEFIKEMLQGWVLDNLETMFTDVNTKVGTIAGEVGQTPSSWNAGIFSMIDNLSDTVMVPIAGMIISAILCYELITMVMDKNNMHEMGSEFFFRYLVKACIAVLLVSYTSDITMAIFDVGNHIVTSAAGVITGSTTLDVTSTLQSMFNSQLSTIHGSKGCTYDTTLVISSENAQSEGGHWKAHWIEGDGEAKRIGYVASTRAKYLLVWGVPILKKKDRELLENYGFISSEEVTNDVENEECT